MNAKRLLLGVNIDHVATLRQARGTAYPSPLEAAQACQRGGADGITAHLREDRRHIQDADIFALKTWNGLPLNMEMAPVAEVVQIALKVRPKEVCLVPEKRRELTTEGGLNLKRNQDYLKKTIAELHQAGIEVSLFINPDRKSVELSASLGARCIELHTGALCDAQPKQQQEELDELIKAATIAHDLGLQVNAGHGINLQNMKFILQVPHLSVLNIGHSIIARAVFIGLEAAVREMLAAMTPYRLI